MLYNYFAVSGAILAFISFPSLYQGIGDHYCQEQRKECFHFCRQQVTCTSRNGRCLNSHSNVYEVEQHPKYQRKEGYHCKINGNSLLPINFVIIVMVAALVAGPASRNTNAVPGLIPLAIRAAARGVEAVAQM